MTNSVKLIKKQVLLPPKHQKNPNEKKEKILKRPRIQHFVKQLTTKKRRRVSSSL